MHDYNATRKPLILKEYGRNVQNLAAVMRTIEDRAKRTLHAQGVLKLMAILDANNKYSTENAQKRWDDLVIISEYTLDVDGPYPMPKKSVLNKSLQRPAYAKQPIKFRSYGRNVERLIQKAACTEDPEEQEKMVVGIVKLMKNFSNEWNRDNVDCNTLLTNVKHMAGDKLVVDFEKLKAQNIFHTAHKDRNRGGKTSRSTDNRKKIA